MARTEAEDRAIRKYEAEKIDKIMIRVPKGMRAQIDAHATLRGESRNRFITRAILETIYHDLEEYKVTPKTD